ncbi:MAG: ZTL protein [Candidatus Binatia bacterium]
MATITVLAGVNGAGKSSVAGAFLRAAGADYFNPDEAAAAYRAADPDLSLRDANSRAWIDGKVLLEAAIQALHSETSHRLPGHRSDADQPTNQPLTRAGSGPDHVFETTLGGNTITALLEQAAENGHAVRVVFVGLASVEKHIERVRARVARGGHDIPEETIRQRYRSSRLHLIKLLPLLSELVVFDNSDDADPASGDAPNPKRLLYWKNGAIVDIERALDLERSWAKPILASALELAASSATKQ